MESFQSSFISYNFRETYNPFYNGFQWPTTQYSQPFTMPFLLNSNAQMNSPSILENTFSLYNPLSIRFPLENPNPIEISPITSTSIQRSNDDLHSLFGDPSLLLTQLIDEIEGCAANSLSLNPRGNSFNTSTTCNNSQENVLSYTDSTNSNSIVQENLQHLQFETNETIVNTSTLNEVSETVPKTDDYDDSNTLDTQAFSFHDFPYQSQIISSSITSIERPRRINKNRGHHISISSLSSTSDDNFNQKSNQSTIENEDDSGEYEADLENLLKQMDRREFQESWSKNWTLGLIRFCKYMQLSEKMQIGPAKELKSDDNKCVILVLKKVFQAKPPAGWPNHGVRLQIQCGGFIQDILAWSSINRETWKTIMPLIAKGITQLIKKVGGVHKLKNGHQPYFNACRNALREDNSLFILLKEYSRGVNTKKRKQNILENETKDFKAE